MLILTHNVVSFIMENSNGRAFKGWPINKIIEFVKQAQTSGDLLISSVEDEINGIMLIKINTFAKIFYVSQFICKNKLAINTFSAIFNLKYPDYTLVGERKGKVKTYNNLSRMFKLLAKV